MVLKCANSLISEETYIIMKFPFCANTMCTFWNEQSRRIWFATAWKAVALPNIINLGRDRLLIKRIKVRRKILLTGLQNLKVEGSGVSTPQQTNVDLLLSLSLPY